MSKQYKSKIKSRVKPFDGAADLSERKELIDTMQNYLEAHREHATKRKDAALEKVETLEEEISTIEKRLRKRRNYGTHSGIAILSEKSEDSETNETNETAEV